MKTLIGVLAFLLASIPVQSLADTPPPGSVKSRVYNGAGDQAIGNVSDSLKVNVTNTIPVSGSISVSNFPSTFGVTQSTSPWVVSGTVAATQSGSWSVGVNNFPATQAVTQSGVWSLGRTWNLSFGTDTADVTGSDVTVSNTVNTVITNTPTVNAVQSGAWTVGINNFPGIQPVSQSGTWTTGRTWSLSSGTDSIAAVQSGSWTVTANAGTNLNTSALALSATQTDGTQRTKITDGSTNAAVKAASTAPVASDPALVVAISPNNTIPINPQGKAVVFRARNDYSSVNVTTAAYTELVASTSTAITQLYIFDSSGRTLVLATGGSGSETDQFYIVPGGNDLVNVSIPASTRISVKAVSANATKGEIVINAFN